MASCDQRRAAADKNNTEFTSNLNLQSPLKLVHLDTPTSASSLTCSPADLTPLVTSFNSLGLHSRDRNTHTVAPMSVKSDTTLDDACTTDRPPADVHSKPSAPTSGYSRTTALSHFHSAFQSSKMLQQVLGFQPPEPFARPPAMPPDLEQRFVAGLQEYGLDLVRPGGNEVEMIRQAANVRRKVTAGVALGLRVLDDIREEMESPVKATGQGGLADLAGKPPGWDVSHEAEEDQARGIRDGEEAIGPQLEKSIDQDQQRVAPVEVRPSTTGCGEDSSATKDNDDDFYDPRVGFGSTTTLVDSEPSRHGSPVTAIAKDAAWNINAVQAAPYASDEFGTPQGSIGADYKPPLRSSSLINVMQHLPPKEAEQTVKSYINKYLRPHTSSDAKQPGSSAPTVLFPPQQVEKEQSWDLLQSQRVTSAPDSFATESHARNGTEDPTQSNLSPRDHYGLLAPRRMTPMPLVPFSRKRAATSQEAPSAKIRPDDSTTGLPILDANQEMLWMTKFPGNTYALLTIILAWAASMRRLYDQLCDPYLFSINPAFPHPITPPLHQKLISVAFYDNSTTPHKEIRFIGPKDATEISYNEVSIFSTPSPPQSDQDSKLCAVKRAMGLKPKFPPPHADGSGRWCYITIKAHEADPVTEPAPHVMIAFPKSAITDSSDCLNTVYPDAVPIPLPPPPTKAPKRFSSLQNLAAAMRFDKSLRAACSSGYLPAVVDAEVPEGALMLNRRVVKMERAGKVPLIEGYRVDVKRWEGWMEAVRRGRGKVIMWMERE